MPMLIEKTFAYNFFMFANFGFFQREYQKYLKLDYQLDARLNPYRLIDELKSSSYRKDLTKILCKKTKNGFKIMRKLTLSHMLVIYSNKCYELVENFVSEPYDSSDEWLNQQCIRTYFHFLRKLVASQELYTKVKELSPKDVCFESIFYIINLMTEMFKIVAKMPLLGRYFKDSNEIITTSFVETIAVQAQKLYTIFKHSLQEILSHPRNYLQSKNEQKLVKAIIDDSLPFINEEMKKLFLDKYFYPYGKGIGIRLFRTQEQPEQTVKIIKGILSDHKDTERELQQANLEKTMFPEEGKVNIQFFERTLKPVDKNKEQEVVVRDLEDIEEEEEIVLPTKFDESVVGKIQKETSHHIEICHDV